MRAEQGDERAIQAHLDRWGEAGWELVSANAAVLVYSANVPGNVQSFVRHYFYWRKEIV